MGYEQTDPLEEYGSIPDPMVLTKSTTYADYADVVGGGIAISAATAATPIKITTASAHGLSTGGRVVIGGVAGGSEANGTWTVDVVDATNFTLRTSVGTSPGTASTGFVTAKWATTARVLDGIMLNSNTTSTTNEIPAWVYYGDYAPGDTPIYKFQIINKTTSRINRRNGIGRNNGLRFRSEVGFIIVADVASVNWVSTDHIDITPLYREVM